MIGMVVQVMIYCTLCDVEHDLGHHVYKYCARCGGLMEPPTRDYVHEKCLVVR